MFFLGAHSRAMVYFSYGLMPCLVLLGFSCFMFFPFFCSLSISFCVFVGFLVFFSRYPFSCHVVPFPLFRPSLTRVYEKKLFFFDTFCRKKHCICNVRHAKVHFPPKMPLMPQKCTGTFLTFWKKCTGTFLTYQNGGKCTVHFGRSPPLKGWGCWSAIICKYKYYQRLVVS